MAVDNQGCNGNEDINFRFTGLVINLLYYIFYFMSYCMLCFHIVWIYKINYMNLYFVGSLYLVELWELQAEKAVRLKMEVLQM